MISLIDIYLKHPSVTIDSRNVQKGQIFFAIKGDHFDGNNFIEHALDSGASYCVSSDEKYFSNPSVILVEDTLLALQDLARSYRNLFNIPVLAITGSNGKTTTKELLACVMATKFKVHVTKGNFNNHLGVPLTLLAMPRDTQFAIVEMGANHIGEIGELCEIARPDHGLITNIGIAHLEGFGSEEGIKIAKSELMQYLRSNDGTQFINVGEQSLKYLLDEDYNDRVIYGDKGENSIMEYNDTNSLNLTFKFENKLYETQLYGAYNFNNVVTAFEVGKYFNCDPGKMIDSIINYNPTNNRSQVLHIDGVTLLLDAYNANPSSMHKAISDLAAANAANKSLILGDMLELGDMSIELHRRILTEISKNSWGHVILVGAVFYSLKYEFDRFTFFETTSDAEAHIDWKEFDTHTVLIKGSRGLKLEQLLP